MAQQTQTTRPKTLITGGSRGIGAAVAEQLARAGHDLALTYRERREEAEAVAERSRAEGASVTLLQADFAEVESAAGVVERAIDALGGLTALVNNAGVTGRIGAFADTDDAEADWVFRVNVLSPLAVTRAAIAWMREHDGGAIVNVSSGAATSGAPHTYIPYAMSKAALNALTTGASKEFAADGIRVNTVSPGTTFTEIHAAGGRPNAPEERAHRLPMGRAAYPEEVASAVVYLLSPAASYVNGANIRVTGG